MIYQDVYQFLLNKASAKEIDIIIELLSYRDWESNILIDPYFIAKQTNTTARYVNEVLKKFSSKTKEKHILKPNNEKFTNRKSFKLLIGKSSIFYSLNDKYCKKFKFLSDNIFKNLSLYAKRMILMAAMAVSGTDQKETFIDIHKLLRQNEWSVGLIPNKTKLLETIEKINANTNFQASLVSNPTTRAEMIYFNLNQVSFDTYSNFAERKYIREILFNDGYYKFLSDETCIEIEKTGKYIFNSLLEQSRSNTIGGVTDELLLLARTVFTQSLHDLASPLIKDSHQFTSPKEVSAYLSSIIYYNMIDEYAKYQNQAASIRALPQFAQFRAHSGEDLSNFIRNKVDYYQAITAILKNWIEEWVYSRARSTSENMAIYSENENVTEQDKIAHIKETVKQFFSPVQREAENWGARLLYRENRYAPIEKLKNTILNHLDIFSERATFDPA